MIYIIAPYSLKLNTTSRNRILSFYRIAEAQGLSVTIISPPSLFNISTWYNQEAEKIEGIKVIYLPELENTLLASVSKPAFKQLGALFKLVKGAVAPLAISYTFKKYVASAPLSKTLSLKAEDIIICSYPSTFSLHLTRLLIKADRCKMIIDYRDPWTYGYDLADIPKAVSRFRKIIERRNENFFLKAASAITVISEELKAYFPSEVQSKVAVVRNGANLSSIDTARIQEKPDRFRLIYLGHIYDDQLKNTAFFDAVRRFIDARKLTKRDFELIFVGANNSKLVHVLSRAGLSEITKIYPTLNISDSMEIAYHASAFFHLRYGNARYIHTSKHADYVALQKPIILPISDGGILAASIRANEGGYVCNNEYEFGQLLNQLWKRHQSGESFKIRRDADFLYKISREAEAKKLIEIIREVQKRSTFL